MLGEGGEGWKFRKVLSSGKMAQQSRARVLLGGREGEGKTVSGQAQPAEAGSQKHSGQDPSTGSLGP